MSDIYGSGHGSAHEWRADITDIFSGGKGTRYFCSCGQCFVHLYDVEPDIFRAMEIDGVPIDCHLDKGVSRTPNQQETSGDQTC